jgi:predicted aspartyl protease
MEINRALIEGLVDIGASMSVMAANVVRELGIMHLMASHEIYKTTSSIVMQAIGMITKLPIKVKGIICQMIFLVVDIDNYDLLLGLDFLIKIGVVIDVEKGIIQVHNILGMEVEVLPLNVMNMLHALEIFEEEKCNIQKTLFNK